VSGLLHPRAVVLLSGGLDSSTTLFMAREQGFELHALSFDYGQRHRVELRAAKRVAKRAGVTSHRVVKLDLRGMGGSALTDEIDVPKHRSVAEIGCDIPVTYVPARNTIFLSYALGLAEVLGAEAIFLGVNALDFSGYPDCRPDYIEAFERLANLATKAAVESSRPISIQTPLMHMNKAEIVLKARSLGLDISMTMSCYDPTSEGLPCGACDACLLREQGIAQANQS